MNSFRFSSMCFSHFSICNSNSFTTTPMSAIQFDWSGEYDIRCFTLTIMNGSSAGHSIKFNGNNVSSHLIRWCLSQRNNVSTYFRIIVLLLLLLFVKTVSVYVNTMCVTHPSYSLHVDVNVWNINREICHKHTRRLKAKHCTHKHGCVFVCTRTAPHIRSVHMCDAFECNQLIHVCSDRRFEPADLKYKNETRSLQTHVSSTRACCVHIWCIANTFDKNIFSHWVHWLICFNFFTNSKSSLHFRFFELQFFTHFFAILQFIYLIRSTEQQEKKKLPGNKMPIQSKQNLEKMSKTDTIKMRNRYIGWVTQISSEIFFRSFVLCFQRISFVALLCSSCFFPSCISLFYKE